MKGAKKVPDQKQKVVAEFVKLIKDYPIVGIVNMENLPAKQLQNMRETLRGEVVIQMTKKRLIRIIFENTKADKKGIEKLEEQMRGMPALIFTKENPFSLYKKLDKNKSNAPAKAGQTANIDIVIPAGPTPFSPGPVIGELGALKIKAGVEDGKVAIKEAATVVKEGEEISSNVAGLLTRLGIEPMEVGLDLVAVYEDGSIYGKDVLSIDESEYLAKVGSAASESFSLAISIAYACEDTIKILLQKAHSDAYALGKSENIVADELVSELLATAEGQMQGLKNQLNLPEAEEPKDEVPEEKPAEEPKEESAEDKPVEVPKEESAEDKPAEESKEEIPEEKPAEEPKEEVPEDKPAEESKEEVPEDKPTEESKEEIPEEKPAEEPKEESAEDKPVEVPKEEAAEDKPAEEPAKEEVTEDKPAEESKEETEDIENEPEAQNKVNENN